MLKNGRFYYDGKYIPEFLDDFQVGNTWRGHEIKKIDLVAVVSADQYPRAILDLTLINQDGDTWTKRVASKYEENDPTTSKMETIFTECMENGSAQIVPGVFLETSESMQEQQEDWADGDTSKEADFSTFPYWITTDNGADPIGVTENDSAVWAILDEARKALP